MIGVEADDVLVLREMFLDVGEQVSDVAVDMAEALPKLLLIDCELRQTHAGNVFVDLKEALRERQ